MWVSQGGGERKGGEMFSAAAIFLLFPYMLYSATYDNTMINLT